jgi:regulator of protease activity HflC (stomatin/prohibitin superfamily)
MAIADLKAFSKKVSSGSKLPPALAEQLVMSMVTTVIGQGQIKDMKSFKAEVAKFLTKVETEMKKG